MSLAGRLVTVLVLCAFYPVPAAAEEIWVGIYTQKAGSYSLKQAGTDLKLGWRSDPVQRLRPVGKPSIHVLLSANLDGGVNYAATGLSWRLGSNIYLRPGIGIALQDGACRKAGKRRRNDLGSRVLLEPELAAGWQITDRLSVEVSWIHLSHAGLFSDHNPGTNSFGIRTVFRLP